RRSLSLLLIMLCATGAMANEESEGFSEFTDLEGRTIRAKIVRVYAEDVWIRRDDNQLFRLPIARFSAGDQKRIEEWRVLEDLRRLPLKISSRQFTANRQEIHRGDEVSYREDAGYEVTVRNPLNHDLENLRVEYRVYKRAGGYEN